MRNSSLSEKPVRRDPRKLRDWLNPTGEKKVHSLVDKISKEKNLQLAWQQVKRNGGAGGIDRQSIRDFAEELDENLSRLHEELKSDTYRENPVKQKLIPKAGQPGASGRRQKRTSSGCS